MKKVFIVLLVWLLLVSSALLYSMGESFKDPLSTLHSSLLPVNFVPREQTAQEVRQEYHVVIRRLKSIHANEVEALKREHQEKQESLQRSSSSKSVLLRLTNIELIKDAKELSELEKKNRSLQEYAQKLQEAQESVSAQLELLACRLQKERELLGGNFLEAEVQLLANVMEQLNKKDNQE